MTEPRITAVMCAEGRRFGDVRLSPDASTVAFVAAGGGHTALVTVPAAGGAESVVTTQPAPRRGSGTFDWTPDSSAVVYVGVDGALHVQPIDGGPPRRLERTEQAGAPAVSPDGTRVAYAVDRRDLAVALLDPRGAWPVRVSGPADFAIDPSWSADGTTVAWHTWDVPAMPWDVSRIVLAAAPSPGAWRGPAPFPLDQPPSRVAQPRFAPTGSDIGFLCDAGGWLNLWWVGPGREPRPLVPDDHEHGGATWGLGQRTWTWSPGGDRAAFCRNEEGFGRLCLVDVAQCKAMELDRGVFSSITWSGDRLAAVRSGARTPDQIVVYQLDPAGSAVAVKDRRITVARGPVLGFEAAGLVEPEVVSWQGEDRPGVGAVVHGRLQRSARRSPWTGEDGLPPLIVWVHGGPTDQTQVRFHPRSAYFLDRGWNILQVDPRGSTGWGRAYAQALAGEWGCLDADDIAAGLRAAAAQGWGDPARMVVMGGSSGGLAVLAVLGRHPGLAAAGVECYGVTDLVALDETTDRYEAHYTAGLVGPRPGEAARYRLRSPISYAGDIVAPLLVLHGTEDRNVVIDQSDALVAEIRRTGGVVEYHRFEGEGHGWSRPDSVQRELDLIDAFLDRHVLRADPSSPSSVSSRARQREKI
jgi:dipeptidyl aminopeptidase/acylaminoacyl peptidase